MQTTPGILPTSRNITMPRPQSTTEWTAEFSHACTTYSTPASVAPHILRHRAMLPQSCVRGTARFPLATPRVATIHDTWRQRFRGAVSMTVRGDWGVDASLHVDCP
jgi:hypothetical protein